jgi:CheY-like chemotaxis protein
MLLPLSAVAATSAEPVAARPVERTVAQRLARTGSVLIVEDHPVNARVAERLLQKQGYDVTVATNGRAACKAFAAGSFQLILMDIQMPEMDGWEAAQQIRTLETASGLTRTPIIALTASAMEEDRQRSINAGMDDFLTKPLQPAHLTAVVDRWMGRASLGRA